MQQVSPAVLQSRYPPPYHQYPTLAVGSPHSLKSIDATVFGPSVPPIKNSRLANNPLGNNNNMNNNNNLQPHPIHGPPPPEVDPRRLILFNLPVDLVQEYLELYLEHLSGESEIERIDYSNLEDTTVMVTFKSELGAS